MNLKTKIDDSVFIFENVIDDETIIDSFLKEIDLKIKKEEFYCTISLKHNNLNNIDIIKKYSDFDEYEKNIFNNTDKLINMGFEIDRKDIDIPLDTKNTNIIKNKINECVKTIYKNLAKKIYIEYDSVIGYFDKYKMNKHSDGGSNDRICTAVFYLNSKNNNGGDVIFYDRKTGNDKILEYSPVKNNLIIFDSYNNNDTLEHEVTQIENWNRFVYRIYFKINK